MEINITCQNCNFDKPFLVKQEAESEIDISFKFKKIVSVQSRTRLIKEFKTSIKAHLKKFKWLICGNVQIQIHWYLDVFNRQETDKFADLDNKIKPILDSFLGPEGLLIDDCQINSLHTTYSNKAELGSFNFVRMIISFINDYTLEKENLNFFQLNNPIYTAINVDVGNLETVKIIQKYLKFECDKIEDFKEIPYALSLIALSQFKFHRSRLNAFPNSTIFKKEEFEKLLG